VGGAYLVGKSLSDIDKFSAGLCNKRSNIRRSENYPPSTGPHPMTLAVDTIAGVKQAPASFVNERDLAAFEKDVQACWVQDLYRARITWANTAALKTLAAADLATLYARDMTPNSKASETRLWTYLSRVSAGERVVTQWTIFADGKPHTILVDARPYQLADGRSTLFIRARSIEDAVCPESLRMLEAARQSAAYFSLYSMDGKLIERNAAFLRTFGDHMRDQGDVFALLFAGQTDAAEVRKTLAGGHEFRGRLQTRTLAGVRWHMLLAMQIRDPVDGQQVIHVESFDLTDQVEAEMRAREAEALLQRIADEFPQPIAFISADRHYRFVNRTYCKLIGQSRETILGNAISEVGGAEAEDIWNHNWPALARGERTSYERRATLGEPSERWLRLDLVPYTDQNNAVQGGFVFGHDIDALKLAQASLQATEAELGQIANSLPIAICELDLDDRIRFVNDQICKWFGRSRESVMGQPLSELISLESYQHGLQFRPQVLAGETVRFRRQFNRNGQAVWADCVLAPFRPHGEVTGFLLVYSDVTRSIEASLALDEARNTLSSHMDNTPLAVIQLDADKRIKQWTGRSVEIFLWRADEVLQSRIEDMRLFDEEGRKNFEAEIHKLDSGQAERFTAQFRNQRRDRSSVHAEWYGSVLRDEAGKVTSYLLMAQDISARITAEGHLQYVANHDLLTGLANRSQFRARLETEIVRAARQGHHLAVVLLNLDHFKYVNDSLGHQAGDLLLQLITSRLKSVLGDGDLLARTGGDEFMALLDLTANPQRAGAIVDVMAKQLRAPFRLFDQDVFVTASLGVAMFPEDGDHHVELIKNADWAMFRAKDAGRNNVQFFVRDIASDGSTRLSLEAELRRAIERNELELHYQPKIDIASGRMMGAEALLRWRHATRGLVPPDVFIPIAEDTTLIVDIGQWVIEAACRQLAEWRNTFGRATQISINLSAVQLKRKQLAQEILSALAKHALPGSMLKVEVTETSVVTDPLLAATTLEALQAQGIQVAIDDFGKGYSSLIQLKRLPIDELKIDSSFVREIVLDRDDAAIVQAIIGLAHNLDLRVVAEGVETAEQLTFLKNERCDEAQGYFFSRPLPAAEFARSYLHTPAI
jgi:diguanylate cyclase (GGDEF)-like protein/PAS domain S-box-containing protein